MQTLVIEWERTTISALHDKDDTYLYAFSRGNNLLYIGLTRPSAAQTVQQEVKQTFNRIFDQEKESARGLTVWLGYIDRSARHNNAVKRVNDGIIEDAECLSIFVNQPPKNDLCKKSYSGRWDFRVVSKGLPCIYPTAICDAYGNCKGFSA